MHLDGLEDEESHTEGEDEPETEAPDENDHALLEVETDIETDTFATIQKEWPSMHYGCRLPLKLELDLIHQDL